MLSIKLIYLYSNIFALANHSAILPITFPANLLIIIIFKLFTLITFIEYQNLVLDTLGLAIGTHIIIENFFTI